MKIHERPLLANQITPPPSGFFTCQKRLPFVGGVFRPFFGLHSRLGVPSLSAQGCVLEDEHFNRTTDVGAPYTRRPSSDIRRCVFISEVQRAVL